MVSERAETKQPTDAREHNRNGGSPRRYRAVRSSRERRPREVKRIRAKAHNRRSTVRPRRSTTLAVTTDSPDAVVPWLFPVVTPESPWRDKPPSRRRGCCRPRPAHGGSRLVTKPRRTAHVSDDLGVESRRLSPNGSVSAATSERLHVTLVWALNWLSH